MVGGCNIGRAPACLQYNEYWASAASALFDHVDCTDVKEVPLCPQNILHSLMLSREVLILTLSILPGLQGCIS